MSAVILTSQIILKHSTLTLKNEFSKPRKMQFEYTMYVNPSHVTLQYYVYETNLVKIPDMKYDYHITVENRSHNIYGPAVTVYHPNGIISYTEYWKDNKRHNEHGPAITIYKSDDTISYTEYWKDGYKVVNL